MLYKHREKFDLMSVKVGMLFSRFPLTPNQWTILSLVPAIITVYLISQQQLILGAFFFAIAGFLDFVDGAVARVTGRATKFGAYLDTVADRYVEFFAVAGIFFVALPAVFLPANFWLFLYLFGSLMTTYAKAAAKEKGLVEKEIRGGFFERAERLIVLFFGIMAGNFDLFYLSAIIAFLGIATNISALQRILLAKQSA